MSNGRRAKGVGCRPHTSPLATFCLLATAGCAPAEESTYGGPDNYIYFGRDRERITETAFLENAGVVGAQLKYAWRELERERDVYDVDLIVRDIEYLGQNGKRLFIQIQDVSFDQSIVNVPRYLVDDPAFNGGMALQYGIGDDGAPVAEGWVARRWDPAVRERFNRLMVTVGEAVDGRIAGMNLPETAIGFGGAGEMRPGDFSGSSYRDGILDYMSVAARTFPNSVVIEYANFMPGEALPDDNHGYLASVFAHAEQIGVGVGGPDLLPHRSGQQTHSLPLIEARAEGTVAGLAVQWGNLDDINQQTGQPVTVDELYRYARDQLRLDYVFWGTQEPHYSGSVLPYLAALAETEGS